MSIYAVIMFFYYQIMHLLGLFNTAGSHEYACVLFYESCDVHIVSKMPSIIYIKIYRADIEIKFLQVIQSSLKQCYHVK